MRAHLTLVTWNRLALTRVCVESLLAKTPPGYTLTIVDNGSRDGTREYLREATAGCRHVRLKLLDRNMGVSVASNLAWDDAGEADCCVKVDNDLEFLHPQWLHRLTNLLETYPKVGMAAYKLCDWHEASHLPLPLEDGGYAEETTVCGGGCAAIPRVAYERLGFWNEGYGRYGHEDQDYSWRAAKAGFKLASLAPDGMLAHHGYAPGMVDAVMESGKQQSNQARLSGENAYYLYILLYEKGLLPLKMCRKYLPLEQNGHYAFPLNPAFRPVQKLLTELVKTADIDPSGTRTKIDLRLWRGTGGHGRR